MLLLDSGSVYRLRFWYRFWKRTTEWSWTLLLILKCSMIGFHTDSETDSLKEVDASSDSMLTDWDSGYRFWKGLNLEWSWRFLLILKVMIETWNRNSTQRWDLLPDSDVLMDWDWKLTYPKMQNFFRLFMCFKDWDSETGLTQRCRNFPTLMCSWIEILKLTYSKM